MAILQQVNARRATGETLSSAKDEWELRDKQTEADDIGRLGRATKASKNKSTKESIENTGHAELDIKNMKRGRDNAALVLTSAKDEWEGRNKLTISDDIGRLGKLTVSAQSRAKNLGNYDDVGDVERSNNNVINGRRNTSLALTSAREEWENRDKITIPDFMGTVANKTRSSRNKSERITADNTPGIPLTTTTTQSSKKNTT